jgi:hypothetical protein
MVHLVGDIRTVIVVSLFCFAVFSFGVVFAFSEDWSEVTRFTDEEMIFTTDLFTVEHVEWRIRWEYEPQPDVPDTHPSLEFYVYSQEPQGQWFDRVSKRGTEETNGTLFIHDKQGTFYLTVVSAVENYTIIVEQNLATIPEFPSWMTLIVMLLVLTALVTVYRHRYALKRGLT